MSGVLAAMVGLGGPVVDISGGYTAGDLSAGNAFAGVNFDNDGDVQVTTISGGTVEATDWIVPKAAAPGAYEILWHQDSGDALDAGDALDTWLALTSDRTQSLTQTGVGTKTASLTVSIRLGSTVLSQGTVSLSAQAI